MKTRFLIIIGLVIAGIFVGLCAVNVIQNIEDQKSQSVILTLKSNNLKKIS